MSISIPHELKWFYRQTTPYLRWHFASFSSVALANALSLMDPLIIKWLIDRILPFRRYGLVPLAIVFIFSSYEGRILLNNIGSFLTFRANQKMLISLRMRLLQHFNCLSSSYHEKESLGTRLYLLQEPMYEVCVVSPDTFLDAFRMALLTLLALTTMSVLNLKLTCTVLPLLPLFVLCRYRAKIQLHGLSEAVQNRGSKVVDFFQEHLSSIVQLQLLVQERRNSLRGFHFMADVVRAEYKRKRSEFMFTVLSNSLIVLGVVTILAYGSRKVLVGQLSIGALVAFYTYLFRLFEPLSGVVELTSRFQRIAASIRRVKAAFEMEPTVRGRARPISTNLPVTGHIRFHDVRFGYRTDQPKINIADLQIEGGQRIAIVGSNGAGKSTIGKLLTRLWDLDSGTIFIDNIDIRDLPLPRLRSLVCYVPQDSVLLDCSLHDNLRYGNPRASNRELHDAAKIAELHRVIERLPNGWHEPLGPRGSSLSAGERQRVMLARAVLREPQVLILDEATSALDGFVETSILENIMHHLSKTTVILISHQLSAVALADRIIVLQDGELAEHGTRSELHKRCGIYAKLFDSQMSVDHRRDLALPVSRVSQT
jgi:ABC-type multidrug transport system fused ATPase/permease subunit